MKFPSNHQLVLAHKRPILKKTVREVLEMNIKLCHVLVEFSPFISGLLAQDAGSWGGDQGGSSSYSSLSVCLHHGGYRLGGAECAADWARYEAVSQNNP